MHSATGDEHDDKNTGRCPDPAPLQRSGELRGGGDLLTARQRQPDRRPDVQAGKEWPARRTTGPAGMNPRREEIIARRALLSAARLVVGRVCQ
jgi:hypothetical protein